MNDVATILSETTDHVLGAPGDTWAHIVEAGLHRLLLSEELGGVGDFFPDAVAVAMRFGAHAGSVPLLETMAANWHFAAAGQPISDAPVDFNAVAPLLSDNAPLLHLLALLKAAAIVGAMDTIMAMSVDYANTRTQFGRAIGKFQAIQHMLAQMSGEVVAATASVEHAARRAKQPDGPWAVAVAKASAGEAAGIVAQIAHQVHGAIGFTEEFALQRFTRSVWTWREEAGDESYWYDRLGNAVLRDGVDNIWPAIVHGLVF